MGKIQWNFTTWKIRFCSHPSMVDTTDTDYKHAKWVCKDFKREKLREKQDLYVQSDTLLLANIFHHFQSICLQKYEVESAHFLTASRSLWKAALKNSKVRLDLLTDIDIVLLVEKSIRRGICHAIHRCVKTNNKYMKDYDKNKESSYLKHCNINDLYGQWAMSEKLHVNNFKWVKGISESGETFIKSYNEEIHEGYFLKFNIKYLENLHNLHNDLFFYLKEWKLEVF